MSEANWESGSTNDSNSHAAGDVARVKQFHVRLLLPFFFEQSSLTDLVEALQQVEFRDRPLWQSESAENISRDYYTEESHWPILSSLFGTAQSVRYFTLRDEQFDRLFPRDLCFASSKPDKPVYPFRIESKCGVELFLSPFGAGTLSITVELDVQRFAETSPSTAHILDFNYRLAQLQQWSSYRIELEHPKSDLERWNAIPEANRKEIPAPPPEEAPLLDRLIMPGGRYQSAELTQLLLQPVEGRGFRLRQPVFSTYSVVRFDETVDFSHPATHQQLARLLSGLAQVEEAGHAGALLGEPSVQHALLNRNHWAAVGCLGAAHLVSDQPQEVAFNEERPLRARDKYFIPFIAAYQQRLAIHKASEAAHRATRGTGEDSSAAHDDGIRSVLQDMSNFAAADYLPEVSTREVLNRYYELSQEGLRVQRAWEIVNRSVSNLDAGRRTSQQERLATQSNAALQEMKLLAKASSDTLEESKELHAKVEWVEILIIAVYAAELVHIVGGEHGFHFHGWYVALSVIGLSLLAMITALRVLNPQQHLKLVGLSKERMLGAALVFGIFIAAGFAFNYFFPPSKEQKETHSSTGVGEKDKNDSLRGLTPPARPSSSTNAGEKEKRQRQE